MTQLEEIMERVYKRRGMPFVYEACSELLKIKDSSAKKPLVNGDVCETLLVFLTRNYIRDRGIKGDCVRGLVLKDPKEHKGSFRTEVDFVFYTPQIIFCIECKSYSGHKTITDKCTLDNGRYTCDIYAQNTLHAKILHRNLFPFKRRTYQSEDKMHMAMCAFFFANGDVEDLRGQREKAVLPIVTQENLYSFYDYFLRNNTQEVWDFNKVNRFLKRLEGDEKLRDEHKKYLHY